MHYLCVILSYRTQHLSLQTHRQATKIQKVMRAQGADPGDVPSPNATGVEELAESA